MQRNVALPLNPIPKQKGSNPFPPKRGLSPFGVSFAELLLWGEEELRLLGSVEARLNAEKLLSEISGTGGAEIYLEGSKGLSPVQIEAYRDIIAKRKNRIPLAYLTGRAYFWEEMLEVGTDCLIPRPETELLIEVFSQYSGIKKEETFSFLDLGTGSGAIGIALLRRFQKAKGTFSDVSPAALRIAEMNLTRYGLLKPDQKAPDTPFGVCRAEVIVSDLFQEFRGRKWDAIFSNPPYFSAADWRQVEPEILQEPALALDGGTDGLDFYRRITGEAGSYLKPGGWLVMEMGIHQAPKVKNLFTKNGFKNILVFKDHAAVDRAIMAQHG